MVLQARRWLPGRDLVLVADSSFAALDFLAALACHGVICITRLRFDAALYDPAPPRLPGTVGRPRTKGKRLPNLSQRSLCLGGCALALCALAACTQRLDANFDGDPLGAPLTSPAPTPPNDIFVWRTTFATAVVVANPAGGNWVRVTPTQAHLVSPDDRRVFLIANTEPLSAAGPQLSGGLRVRLDGLGTLGIGVRPASRPDYLGAVEVSNFLPPAGGSVHAMRPFSGEMLSGFWSLPGLAQLSAYTAGDVVEILWAIDQSTHTFSANVVGGPTVSSVFPATSSNLATTPMTGVQMVLWLQRPTTGTVAFVDDTFVDEWR